MVNYPQAIEPQPLGFLSKPYDVVELWNFGPPDAAAEIWNDEPKLQFDSQPFVKRYFKLSQIEDFRKNGGSCDDAKKLEDRRK